ncbi:hypothetical protein G6F57_017223 [Rhizopus arrhizus]|nr:hypothetical protein G6F57_017223 [Rhizopus arrhizus]
MVCVQNEISRAVSLTPSSPMLALNHWRSSATTEISAMVMPVAARAAATMASNTGSGGVSSRCSRSSSSSRSASSMALFRAGWRGRLRRLSGTTLVRTALCIATTG